MTTLAQRMVETTWKPRLVGDDGTVMSKWHRETGTAAADIVRNFLAPKIEADEDPEDFARRRATRFVFTEDAPLRVYAMHDEGSLPEEAPWRFARLPSPFTWVEWRMRGRERSAGALLSKMHGEIVTIGALMIDANAAILLENDPLQTIGQNNDIVIILCVGAESTKIFRPVGILSIPMFSDQTRSADKIKARVHWMEHSTQKWSDGKVSTIVKEIVQCLFLINTPRVCERVEVSHAIGLQKARAKARKPPLMDYTRVVLHVGLGGKRAIHDPSYQGPGSGPEHPSKRRLHEVIGHFRTLTKGRSEPQIVFVPPHWRGDPEIGIMVKDRDVSIGKASL